MNLRQYLHQWSSIYFARKPRLGNGASRWNWLLLFIDRVGQRCRRSASGSGQVGVGDHGVTELRDECPRVTTSPPDKWHCAPVPAVSGHADNAQLWDYSRVSPVSSVLCIRCAVSNTCPVTCPVQCPLSSVKRIISEHFYSAIYILNCIMYQTILSRYLDVSLT